MRRICAFLFMMILAVSSVSAKPRHIRHSHRLTSCLRRDSIIIHEYVDSLRMYKHYFESLKALEDSTFQSSVNDSVADGRYARLFTPLNFYPDLAHRHFSLESADASTTDNQMLIDDALMNIYLNHPELVSTVYKPLSQREQKKKDPSDDKKDSPSSAPAPVTISQPKADEMAISDFDLVISKPNFWTFSSDTYLQAMQNYYSDNWYQGGESNFSVLSRVTLQANYNNKQKTKVENKLEMQLGYQTTKADEIHKLKTSSDLLRYTGKLGIQASKKWYYTLQIVAASQFAKTFASNSNTVQSSFLSPAKINASLGMDYNMSWFKKRLTGSVHLAPVAMNYVYVGRDELTASNGIKDGSHHLTDYGSTFTLDATWKFSDNISWKTRLYAYTTYKRFEMQWENTISLKVSRYLSTNIYIYPRYDDSRAKDKDFGHYQLKEYTSFGFSYSF